MENGAVENGDKCIENSEPYIIINNQSCKILDIENRIRESEIVNFNEILKLNSVARLDFSKCHLLKFPLEFCIIDYITDLNISGNELQVLPDEFVNLKKLRILNISKNLFEDLPSALYNGLHLVKVLNVSNNSISHINKTPCCLPKLQHLDLSCNKLLQPPSWLMDDLPSCMEYIDLSNNPCFEHFFEETNLSTQRKVADQIKTLKITNCKFRECIGNFLLSFNNLHTLEIGTNLYRTNCNYVSDLKNIPGSIVELLLPNIGLAGVSSSITDLKSLRHLDISNNKLHWLPASMKNLTSLVILHAESCNLCLMPSELNELTSLKELHLGSNQLASAEGFENLINLEVLDLYGNQLISLPNFLQFSKLVGLDLCQNYVEPPSLIEVNNIKLNYEEAKGCLRGKIQNCNRRDGAKEFPEVTDDDLDEEISNYSLEESDIVDADLEDVPVQNKSMSDHGQDIWEVDENETFDPNFWTGNQSLNLSRNSSHESLTGETPYEVTTHPHYFTPFQLVSPVIICKNSLPPPVEGQFDD